MHRLFLALTPPQAIVDACFEAMEDGPAGWDWQDETQLHVTLRFIGEVDRRQADDIADALLGFHAPTLDIAIDGVGWFDHGPRGALFARVKPKAPLEALHDKLNRLLVRLGHPPERRAYLPHVTLARRRRGAEPPDHWLARYADFRSPSAAVDRVTLFESRLSKNGASYQPVLNAPLTARP